MATLDLIEVIDENFRVYPTFFSLDPFLKKVEYPKLRIFGFNKELLHVSSKEVVVNVPVSMFNLFPSVSGFAGLGG